MGTFDAEGNYVPRQITENDLVGSFADAIEGTMVEVEDGQVVFHHENSAFVMMLTLAKSSSLASKSKLWF
jgi:hypothetical protein